MFANSLTQTSKPYPTPRPASSRTQICAMTCGPQIEVGGEGGGGDRGERGV